MKNKVEVVLQLSLILICLFVLSTIWKSAPVIAQGACAGEPTLYSPTNPKERAYPQGKTYAIVVFNPTTDTHFQQIRDGALDWNEHKLSNCSDVTFQTAVRAPEGLNHTDTLPNDTIWYFRENAGHQFLPEFRYIGGTQLWEIRAAKIRIWSGFSSTPAEMRRISTHELGHGFGLNNETIPYVQNRSIMGNSLEITGCDTEAIKKVYCPAPTPSPSPSSTPNPPSGCHNWLYNTFEGGVCPLGFTADGETGFYCCEDCLYQTSEQVWDPSGYELDCSVCQDGLDNDCSDGGADDFDYDCDLCFPSPIVIDTLGDGFNMSSAASGVNFDIRGVGRPIRVSWTQGDDAWLALDRNGNGTIDNGKELFGNFTYQLSSPERNGFRALDVYDEVGNGGNEDGLIDNRDAIYPTLLLWLDSNRNGVSEPAELHTLASKDVATLELDYRVSQRTDGNGNRFRYRAKVRSANGADLGRWAWDVFLATETRTVSLMDVLLNDSYATRINFLGNRSSCRKTYPQHLSGRKA